MTVDIAEYFFSVQGEGISAGVPSLFIRFPGCNLLCGGHMGELVKQGKATWWCDTETMWMKAHVVDTQTIYGGLSTAQRSALHEKRAHVVYTGGEPTMAQNAKAIEILQRDLGDPFCEIETNGTIDADILREMDQINCSPKLANSGMPKAQRIRSEVLCKIAAMGGWFKFVVTKPNDWEEIVRDFLAPHQIHPNQVILMPGCDRRADLAEATRMVWEMATSIGVRMCSRMHILAFDKLVGV